jgi:hypothetical protein
MRYECTFCKDYADSGPYQDGEERDDRVDGDELRPLRQRLPLVRDQSCNEA